MIITHPTAVLQQIRAETAPRVRAHQARQRRRAWFRGLASAFDGTALITIGAAFLWVGAAVLIAWAVEGDGRVWAALRASYLSTAVVWLCLLFYGGVLLLVILAVLWQLVHWMDDEPQGRVISSGRPVTRVDP